jgi:hypothetical protein
MKVWRFENSKILPFYLWHNTITKVWRFEYCKIQPIVLHKKIIKVEDHLTPLPPNLGHLRIRSLLQGDRSKEIVLCKSALILHCTRLPRLLCLVMATSLSKSIRKGTTTTITTQQFISKTNHAPSNIHIWHHKAKKKERKRKKIEIATIN